MIKCKIAIMVLVLTIAWMAPACLGADVAKIGVVDIQKILLTSSAGKISVIGTAEVNGETVFALKFTEARNMEWMDKVFLAKFDELENTIANLAPYDTDKFFFEEELAEIESNLETKLAERLKK